MKPWKRILIPAITFSLLSPAALWSAGEEIAETEEITPSFQNAAQAERAANLAHSSFTEEDMEQARQQAAVEAESKIEQLSNDYADGVVEQISTDYADKVVDETAKTRAEEYVEQKAHEYALGFGEEGSPEYSRAYAAASDRATDPSFHNALDTAYEAELERLRNPDDPNFDETVWQEAYGYAKGRATGDGYQNAWQTAYDYAYQRATNPNFPNAFQTEYQKSLEAEVADITGQKLQDIHQMRYVEKLGWGVITKKRLGLHPSHSGLGNKWKHNVPPSLDDEIIPPGPEQAEIPLEEEIAEATQRNIRTGWNDDSEVQAKGNGKKGNNKKYGLTQTSGLTVGDVRGNNKGGNSKGNNKSSVGNPGQKGSTTNAQGAASAASKNNNSNKGGNSSSNGNKGGKSDNNGNKGGNGKNK